MTKKKIFALIIAFAMILAVVPPSVVSATQGDNETVTLDVGKGVIDIYPEGYSQTQVEYTDIYDEYGEWLDSGWVTKDYLTPGDASKEYKHDEELGEYNYPTEWQPFKGTYIITGNSGYTDDPSEDIDFYACEHGKDTFLEIMNFSGQPVEYNLVFDNLKVRSYDWCTAIKFKGNAPITVNIINKGDTVIEGHNHAAFKIHLHDTNYNNIYVNIYNTLGSTLSLKDRCGETYEEEIWNDELGYYEYIERPRAQIYGSDGDSERGGVIIFKINEGIVNDGTNGGTVGNLGDEYETLTHEFHNFIKTARSTHNVNAIWTEQETAMTQDEFNNNSKNIVCTFKCVECGEVFEVDPTVLNISEDGTQGTYKAVLPADRAKTADGKAVESIMTYGITSSGNTPGGNGDTTTGGGGTDTPEGGGAAPESDDIREVPETGIEDDVMMLSLMMMLISFMGMTLLTAVKFYRN